MTEVPTASLDAFFSGGGITDIAAAGINGERLPINGLLDVEVERFLTIPEEPEDFFLMLPARPGSLSKNMELDMYATKLD